MQRLLKSRFFADYGSLFILLLLCTYYSYATLDEQHPSDRAAGRQLAQRLISEADRDSTVVIAIRETALDQVFAEAIATELESNNFTHVEVIAGQPIDIANGLIKVAENGKTVEAIATHHAGSRWGPLQPERLQKLAAAHPSFGEPQVLSPKSYIWPSFLTRQNLLNVINQNADVAIIAIGMTMVIITAGIDLSVGSLLAVSAVLAAIFIQSFGGGADAGLFSLIFCSLLAIGICTLGGVGTGIMVTWFSVPAFVVTLSMLMIARGLALIFAVRYQKVLSGGTTEGTPEAIKIEAELFGWLGNGEMLGIPNPIWLMMGLYLLFHIVMTRTVFGRYVYAVGGNPEAAKLSGVPVKKVLIAVYALCAALAGLGGIVDASRFEGGRPNAGDLYELQVIAAVVVGGTSLSGGQGKIFGTLIGALMIAVIQNGLNMASVKSYEQKVVFGLLILGAVVIDQLKKRVR